MCFYISDDFGVGQSLANKHVTRAHKKENEQEMRFVGTRTLDNVRQ